MRAGAATTRPSRASVRRRPSAQGRARNTHPRRPTYGASAPFGWRCRWAARAAGWHGWVWAARWHGW
eukprot:1659840-Prymnesium_polylepis.1